MRALTKFRRLLLASSLVVGVGCNAFDSPAADGVEPDLVRPRALPPSGGFAGASGGMPVPTAPSFPMQPAFPTGDPPPLFPMVAPDDSPVVTAETPPPPIEGGTLLLTRDGAHAVVSDADRDRVVIVDLEAGAVSAEIALEAGDVPGRLVEDEGGRVHVVLRRAGEVATVSLDTGELLRRRSVCGVPRGIDYRASSRSVLVACAGGELVEFAAAGGGSATVRHVEPDLQDVVVTDDDRVHISTFKRAELLEIDGDGAVLTRRMPAALDGPFFGTFTPGAREQHMAPAVAWSALRAPDGGVAMVHQRAQTDEIDISEEMGGGGYGDGLGCTSIVQSGVTFMGADGSIRSLPPLMGMVLPVDGAISHDGRWLAIAVAGSPGDAPPSTPAGVSSIVVPLPPFASEGIGAIVIDTQAEYSPEQCIVPGSDASGGVLGTGQTVGVDFDARGRLVTLGRAPAELRVYDRFDGCQNDGCPAALTVPLGGAPVVDTGHDLFHKDAGGGIACASCHPGGTDDGQTWTFSQLGPRRTQLFNMGIAGTEPLHWDGDMADLNELMGEVFVRRMGGRPQSEARVGAMASWIESLEPHPPLRTQDDPAVLRGKALFESEEVGCAECHSGERLSDNRTVDVGTGGVFQVPSLVNVAYHQPYVHNGCAQTLRERFDPECGGGDRHGRTSQLDEDGLGDLVAYLESL